MVITNRLNCFYNQEISIHTSIQGMLGVEEVVDCLIKKRTVRIVSSINGETQIQLD